MVQLWSFSLLQAGLQRSQDGFALVAELGNFISKHQVAGIFKHRALDYTSGPRQSVIELWVSRRQAVEQRARFTQRYACWSFNDTSWTSSWKTESISRSSCSCAIGRNSRSAVTLAGMRGRMCRKRVTIKCDEDRHSKTSVQERDDMVLVRLAPYSPMCNPTERSSSSLKPSVKTHLTLHNDEVMLQGDYRTLTARRVTLLDEAAVGSMSCTTPRLDVVQYGHLLRAVEARFDCLLFPIERICLAAFPKIELNRRRDCFL